MTLALNIMLLKIVNFSHNVSILYQILETLALNSVTQDPIHIHLAR